MKFQIKCALQWLFSCSPKSTQLNRLMQIYVTKSLPISNAELQARISIVERHMSSYFKIRGSLPNQILDIGSGSDLSLPLLMTKYAQEVVASDIDKLASNYLIENAVNRIGLSLDERNRLTYLVYRPPIIPLKDNSFDLITSTSVLEHVPKRQVPLLASEIYRLLKPNGISTHHIAHKDHWSDTDSSIHPMNYLRYGEMQWKKYNPPLLHQNRLLSCDFEGIFAKVGFQVQRNLTKIDPPGFQLADCFQHYNVEDLSTTHTWLTLSKNANL